MRCQFCENLSFLPYDLVLWCGCSAAILYHILEAMSRALSVFFGEVTSVLQAVANNSMSKMGGLSSIAPHRSLFSSNVARVYGEDSLAHPQYHCDRIRTNEHRTGSGTPLGRYHKNITNDLFHDPLDSRDRRAWWEWLVSRWALALGAYHTRSYCQEAFAA